MRDKDLIHLPEFYLKFGSLKKYLRRLYNLKVIKQKVKPMKDPRITEEVKEQIEEKIISSFLSTEFMQTYFVDQENVDVDFEMTTEGVPIDQVLLTVSPMDTQNLSLHYDNYLKNSNEWAHNNGLHISSICAGQTVPNEITFVFDIVDLDKLLVQESTTKVTFPVAEILEGINDRAKKIHKHSTEMNISTTDAQELKSIYDRLRAIEENCDTQKAAIKATPKPGQKFWATLYDRNGKQKDRMEVSFKEDDYARAAFQAAGHTVHATDVIKFE